VKLIRQIALFGALAILVCAGFQNCGQAIPGFGKIGTVQDGPGNGSGYDSQGLPASVFQLRGICGGADGSVVSQIVFDGEKYYLTIDQCHTIVPPQALVSGVTSDPSHPGIIEYNGQTYTREK
jgi:hypothetical protein